MAAAKPDETKNGGSQTGSVHISACRQYSSEIPTATPMFLASGITTNYDYCKMQPEVRNKSYFHFRSGKWLLHFRNFQAWCMVGYTRNGMPDPENPIIAVETALLCCTIATLFLLPVWQAISPFPVFHNMGHGTPQMKCLTQKTPQTPLEPPS